MTTTQLILAFREAPKYYDFDEYVYDLWYEHLKPDGCRDPQFAKKLQLVWIAANGSFSEFLRELGYTQTGLSQEFGIPLRTVQDWCGNRRTPPAYLRLLLLIAVESF